MPVGGGLSKGSLDAFLERLADDHRQLLSSIAAQSAQALQREERRVMVMALRELEREHHELSQELSDLTGDRLRRIVGQDFPPPPLPGVPDIPFGGGERNPEKLQIVDFPDVTEVETLQLVSKKMQVAEKPTARPARHRGQLALVRDAPQMTISDEDMFGSHEGGSVHVGKVVTDGSSTTITHAPPPMLKRAMTKYSLGKPAWDTDEMVSSTEMKRNKSMLEPVADVKRKLLRKQRLRLRGLLGLRVNECWVSAETLQAYIARRYPSAIVETATILEVMEELKKVHISQNLFSSEESVEEDDCPGKISFKMLVELISDHDLMTFVHPDMREDVDWFCKALLAVTVEEVIENATNVHGNGKPDDPDSNRGGFFQMPSRISVLKAIIPLTVLMSISCLALSLDALPGSRVWIVPEVIFTAIFVTEVIVKLVALGPEGYFRGKDSGWNTLDFTVTSLAVIDVSISLYQLTAGSLSGATAQLLSFLRALRILRVLRLAKLLRTRFLKNFTNMLTGFMLGLPALFGVLFLFLVVLFVLGLAFRIMWGPEVGQNFIRQCGMADEYLDMNNFGNRTEYCDRYIHYMYGEEFFGTVWLSMFTTFRFMLGDYQSKNGVSLAIVFGEGYGAAFHMLFGIGMICCVFGLFNIVTAIFVDSTISGLKHNDIMRKYAQQYEGRYVKSKLMALIQRVGEIMAEQTHKGSRRVSLNDSMIAEQMHGRFTVAKRTSSLGARGRSVSDEMESLDKIVITFDDFCEIMVDTTIQECLRDLDVEVYNPASFFESFDADDTGVITIMALVQNIMRLRGEVRKNDMIASLVAVRALGKRFDQLTLAMDTKNMKVNADRNPVDSGTT